jgi:hypothetical protein
MITTPPSHTSLPGLVKNRLSRFIFGDDIFISYARADAGDYAAALAARLARKNYICFLDQIKSYPDTKVSKEVLRRLRNSTVLVLVGTEKAAQSRNVAKELRVFFKTGRPVIPLNVNGALEQARWYQRLIRGMALINVAAEQAGKAEEAVPTGAATNRGRRRVISETREALLYGEPSDEVIRRIENSFTYTRRSTVTRALFLTILLFSAAVAGGAWWGIATANAAVVTAEQNANKEIEKSNRAVKMAQENAEERIAAAQSQADKRVEEIEKDTEEKIKTANIRVSAAERQERAARANAAAQQKIAEQQAQRAAEEALKVKGSQATLRGGHPGEELEALRLATEAAGPWVLGKKPLPEEIRRGLEDAVMAANYSLPLPPLGVAYGGAAFVREDQDDLRTRLYTVARTGKPDDLVRKWDDCLGNTPVHLIGIPDDANLRFVTFSPNGSKVAFTDEGGTVYVSDSKSGVLITKLRGYKAGTPLRILFSNGDRKLLTIEGQAKEARLWNLEQRTQERRAPEAGELIKTLSLGGPIRAAALSGSGDHVVLGGEQGLVKFWNFQRGSERTFAYPFIVEDLGGRGRRPTNRKATVISAAFANDTKHIATGDQDGWVRLWMISDLDKPVAEFQHYSGVDEEARRKFQGEVMSVAFSRDDRKVLTASTDHTARILDRMTFKELGRMLGHTRRVTSASFIYRPEGVLTVSDDGTARLWNLASRTDAISAFATAVFRNDTYKGGTKTTPEFRHVIVSPDRKRVLTIGEGGEARLWDATNFAGYDEGTGERLNAIFPFEKYERNEPPPPWAQCMKSRGVPDDLARQNFLLAGCLLSKYVGHEPFSAFCDGMPQPKIK